VQLTDVTTVVVDKVKYTTNVRLQLAEFMILKDDKNQIDHKTLQNSTQSINQSIKTLIHVDRPQRDKVHMVEIKIKSTMIHNNNNLNLNM